MFAKSSLVEFESVSPYPLSMRKNAKITKIICKRIRRYRHEASLTQEDLAEKVGVSRVYIGYVEQGRNTPSLEILDKIAKALKVRLSDIIE